MTIEILRRTIAFLTFSAALALATTDVQAHAALKTANPAPNATVAAPKDIVLHFSEALEMKLSSFKVTTAAGVEVMTMAMPAPDKLSIAAMPMAPLAPGQYTVSWTAVGDDSHPNKGTYSFTVK
jgi:methionine-rich copper-binding protein CopC